jgi:hypothetical protein
MPWLEEKWPKEKQVHPKICIPMLYVYVCRDGGLPRI